MFDNIFLYQDKSRYNATMMPILRESPERYHRVRLIGKTPYGDVYLGIDTVTNEDVAIKVHRGTSTKSHLHHEANVYNELSPGIGIANKHYFGTRVVGQLQTQESDSDSGDSDNVQNVIESVLVGDLLGPSLEKNFRYCRGTFTLKTVLMLAGKSMSNFFIKSCAVCEKDSVQSDGTTLSESSNKMGHQEGLHFSYSFWQFYESQICLE